MSRAVTVLVLASTGLAGCSTHEARFEHLAPPRAKPTEEVVSSARLALGALDRAEQAPATVIPALLATAAWLDATGDPAARRKAARGAERVLPLLTAGRDTGVVLRAGLTLARVPETTAEPRLARELRRLARHVTSRSFGWRRTPAGAVVVSDAAPAGDVELTALAAAVLAAASRMGVADAARDADLALRAVEDAQVTVGRWPAVRGGPRGQPLAAWARTLDALSTIDAPLATGILGGGVSALRETVVAADGTLRPGLDPLGAAVALRVLASYADRRAGDQACRAAAAAVDDDGAIGLAPAGDEVAQATYAAALAACAAPRQRR